MNIYRASLNGSSLIIESSKEIYHGSAEVMEVLKSFGLRQSMVTDNIKASVQTNGKFSDIDQSTRKELIFQLTNKLNIYSLGRYATWRPKLMLDDLIDDIFVIRRLISGGNYAAKHYTQKGE
jgi:hypothetical protein